MMKVFAVFAVLVASVGTARSGDFFENQYLLRDNEIYTNQQSELACADPGVFRKANGEGFVACTGGTFETGRFPLFKSSDMVNWKPAATKTLLKPHFREPWAGQKRTWAPALTRIGDRYVTYYTQNDKAGNGAIGVAFSKNLGTDYFSSNRKKPLVSGRANEIFIDPSYFHDSGTGKNYLLYKLNPGGRTRIYVRQLNRDGTGFVSKPVRIKTGGTTRATLVEAPEIIKSRGYYYLFYSVGAWDDGYTVKVARSKSIFGPYEGDRLVLGPSRDSTFVNVGGGSIFSVGSRHYYVYHAMKGKGADRGDTRFLMVDEIHFKNEGPRRGPWPEVYDGTPSKSWQFVPGSRLTRFGSVDVSWPEATVQNPSYSFDLVDERNRKADACLNAGVVRKQRSVSFNGICKSLDKNYILVNGFKFRVCAAKNNNWKGPNRKVQCTPYTTLGFDSTIRLGKFR